jgi:hypothetical protein
MDISDTARGVQDVNGCTPLHCAVHAGFADITEFLSTEVPPLALHMEDGVGDTPLETASAKLNLECTTELKNQSLEPPPALDDSMVNGASFPPRVTATYLEGELLKLRATIEQLTQEGLLIKGTSIADELVKFADMMDAKLEEAKAAEANHSSTGIWSALRRHSTHVCTSYVPEFPLPSDL